MWTWSEVATLLQNPRIFLNSDFDYIPSNAFFVNNPDINNNLEIGIVNSQISGSSFGSDVFTNPNRILNIIFQFNQNFHTLKVNISFQIALIRQTTIL